MYKGWFSAKQEDFIGYAIYEDDKGREIKITEVSDPELEDSPSHWDDTVCVGPVYKFIRGYWNMTFFQ